MKDTSRPALSALACKRGTDLDLAGRRDQQQTVNVRRVSLLLGPMFIFLTVFVWVIALTIPKFSGPSGAAYGSDFAVFYEATKVLDAGHNPYNSDLLWHSERTDFAQVGLEIPHNRALIRVGNPPVFFWLLRPLAALPFRAAGIIWTAAMYLCSLLGILMLLRWLGWRRRAFAAGIFLAMPQVVLGAFYGDLIGLIFACVVWSLVSANRHPRVAGGLLALCWLKPHVALPAALLIWAFHCDAPRKLAAGFIAGSIALAALTVGVVGLNGTMQWVRGLVAWTHEVKGQPEIASIGGLYSHWAPAAGRMGLSALFVGIALGLTLLTWLRYREHPRDPSRTAWLWALWVVCIPYAHINDQVLLTFPVLLLLGRNGFRSLTLPSIGVLYVLCFCLILNRIPGVPVDLEPLKLLVVVAIMWRAENRSTSACEENEPSYNPDSRMTVAVH